MIQIRYVLLLCTALATVACAETPDRGRRTWVVWHTECPVYTLKGIDQKEPLKTLKQGAKIEGRKYFVFSDRTEWIAFREDRQNLYAPFAYLTHIPPENQRQGNLPVGREKVDRWHGMPHDYKPGDLKSNYTTSWTLKKNPVL